MSGGGSKSVTVGYKYYVGMHMALCHGPVDKLVRIMVGGKKAWVGNHTGGALTIDKPDLFGGEKREGGVTGQVDIEMGGPTQGQNSYLAARLGADLLPAFRGTCCAVLRQIYIGLNPYLKDWGWLAQRIHTRKSGEAQWYDAKAEIGYYFVDDVIPPTTLDYRDVITTGSLWRYTNVPYTDEDDHFSGANLGRAPFADRIPHSYGAYNSEPWINSGDVGIDWTQIPFSDTLWLSKEISVSDKRPIIFYIASDNVATVWINDTIIAGSAGNMISSFTYTPDKKSFTIHVRVIESEPENTGGDGNYKYFDCYAYQEESEDAGQYLFGDYSDMNPAHIIRECLTDGNWGMGYPESDIDDASFMAGADKLYAEGMGISMLWSSQMPLEDFVDEIKRHIDAAVYVDLKTGKFVLKLIRDDYDVDDLLVLDQSNISRVEGYSKQTLAELVNEITVSFDSNETGQVETVTLQNLAMIQQQGTIIPATVDYPGFANQAIAARAAARDLKAMSTPLVTATIYANREAVGLNIGSAFKWNWVETDEDGNGIATSYIMRVTEIAFGDGVDNTVRIQCTQDVFALPDIVYVEAEPTEWTDPSVAPLPAAPRLVMETPYYEIVRQLGEVDAAAKLSGLPELGYLMVAAGRAAGEINAEVQVDAGAGYVEGGTLDFCPCAALDGAIGRLDTSATLKDGVDLDEFADGSLAQIDDEVVVIESIADGVATIRRGCLDTVPATHADGASVIIWDGYTASDDVEYVASDEVDVKILTATGQGSLSIADAPVDSVIMDQRALRPYRPAGLAAAGNMDPDRELQAVLPVTITWAHRNRLQETAGGVLAWDDTGVTVEPGVTYRFLAEELDIDGNVVGVAIDESISGNSRAIADTDFSASAVYLRITVTAQRDGLDSWKSPSIEIGVAIPIVGDVTIDESSVTIDGSTLIIG